jgi:hypothetical protein
MLEKNKTRREMNFGKEKIMHLEKLDSINIYYKILPQTLKIGFQPVSPEILRFTSRNNYHFCCTH